ncbi:hypothetical protein, partial [Enterococcus faecium]|uniref:hypothetical protein n=1 Tax=Enterococcus faecium TaxID=1352 RepID=UPI001F086125
MNCFREAVVLLSKHYLEGVPYTHLTRPTPEGVLDPGGALTLKKKKEKNTRRSNVQRQKKNLRHTAHRHDEMSAE